MVVKEDRIMSSSESRIGVSDEAPDAAGIYRIWPGAAPGSEGWSWQQSTMTIPWATSGKRLSRNVVEPTLTLFKSERPNGTAMIVAPGGAFHFLMVDHEGYEFARWLAERGVTAFVLKYRLGRTPDADADISDFRNDLQRRLAEAKTGAAPHPSPITLETRLWGEEDGRQAIRFVREHAADWGIDPKRIGIGGFSAGGAVTMGPLMEHDAASRPDFAMPIYAPLREGLPVPADAPPIFVAISDDDTSVSPAANAQLYAAWREAGKSAEFHVFGNGGHGWGMNKGGFLSDGWIDLFGNWLKVQGLLPG
jgi:acetyl esterase/lipase